MGYSRAERYWVVRNSWSAGREGVLREQQTHQPMLPLGPAPERPPPAACLHATPACNTSASRRCLQGQRLGRGRLCPGGDDARRLRALRHVPLGSSRPAGHVKILRKRAVAAATVSSTVTAPWEAPAPGLATPTPRVSAAATRSATPATRFATPAALPCTSPRLLAHTRNGPAFQHLAPPWPRLS